MSFVAKGIICFPHECAIVPFMTMLKLEDMEVFDLVTNQKLITRRFSDIPKMLHQTYRYVSMPVLIIDMRTIRRVKGKHTALDRLCDKAYMHGLTFKIFVQEVSSDQVLTRYCMRPNNDVDRYIQNLGVTVSKESAGMVAHYMQVVVEEAYMEMRVKLGDYGVDTDAEYMPHQTINQFLTNR